jgi:subtilisin family serine protease
MQRNELVSEPKVLWIANALCFEATRDAILSLSERTDIMVIGLDEERNWLPDGVETQPAEPTREITSNVTQVNADQVWNLGYTGQGVVVAVIDTGVNYNHVDVADHLWDG